MSQMIPAWVDGVLQPVEKLAVHQRGLRHKAVSVFVMAGEKLLLQQRALGKYHTPGLWANTCCTHPKWEEEPGICAVRRLDEELGISGLDLTHRGQVEYRADVGGGLIEHEVVEIYAAEATENLKVTPNPDEVEAYRWTHIDELRRDVVARAALYTPWLRIYLDRHSELIFGETLTG
ncbi:MAG: isopentenyl-diphosphate Delta-isomerase [Pseudomonadota bacterium]